jgi:hypothetical protein
VLVGPSLLGVTSSGAASCLAPKCVSASAHAYDVALAGEESIRGRECYHLTLRPRLDPDRFPLRDLWVEETAFEIVQLMYERPYDERHTRVAVLYRFAPVGAARVGRSARCHLSGGGAWVVFRAARPLGR